jgi:hypothetical protein
MRCNVNSLLKVPMVQVYSFVIFKTEECFLMYVKNELKIKRFRKKTEQFFLLLLFIVLGAWHSVISGDRDVFFVHFFAAKK